MVMGNGLNPFGRRKSLQFDSSYPPPNEDEIFYGGARGGSMSDGRVTEWECGRLLIGSQPKGCEGSTPSPSAIPIRLLETKNKERVLELRELLKDSKSVFKD